MGDKGGAFIQLASDTIGSVAKGVLGVAIIQAILAGIGLLAVGVPGAGLWALVVLLIAIVQLPVILVLGPVIAYQFTVMDTTPAVLFTVWCVLVSMSDMFLKPLFLGRSMDTDADYPVRCDRWHDAVGDYRVICWCSCIGFRLRFVSRLAKSGR